MGKVYTCDYCKQNYITKAELKRHMEGIHLRLRQYQCTLCSKSFVTKGQLDIHSYIHRIETPVKCKLCQRLFRRKDCYRRHIRARHREHFEWAIMNAERRKLGLNKIDEPDLDQIDEPVEHIVKIDTETLPVNIRENIEQNGYIELIIPEEIENEYMEASESAQKQNKEDLTFGGLDEHIATLKVESFLTDDTLLAYTKQLLGLLLDATTLDDFGYPKLPVLTILSSIIENCGGKPFDEADADESTRVRENVKLFFTLVMESNQIKSLLNNHTVDEVIQYIIKYLQADDMEIFY